MPFSWVDAVGNEHNFTIKHPYGKEGELEQRVSGKWEGNMMRWKKDHPASFQIMFLYLET